MLNFNKDTNIKIKIEMKNSYCEKEQRDDGKFCTKCGLPQQNNADEVVQIYNVNGIEFKMVKVSGGTFQMGATSEQGTM